MTPEIIGYFATGITLSSFFFNNMLYLRQVNIVGCLWWCAYALSTPETQYPVLTVNAIIMAIHIVWMIRYYHKKSIQKNSEHGK